jgi:DNA polymerase III subunit delta'
MSSVFGENIIGHGAQLRVLSASLAHPSAAYLLTGPAHLGKRTIAAAFVAALLGIPGEPSRLHAHPDFVLLEAEEGKKLISVEQVRSARERLMLRPSSAPQMVMYIPAADRLNEAGTNALLKILEEPPAGAVCVLVAEDMNRLPATLRSRCVVLSFAPVPRLEMEAAAQGLGLSKEEIPSHVARAHGRPGLLLAPQTEEGLSERGRDLARDVLKGPLGVALSRIDEVSKACESTEDAAGAWHEVLDGAMEAVRLAFAQEPQKALIVGIGLVGTSSALYGPIPPRLMLESTALRLSSTSPFDVSRLFSTHIPSALHPMYNLSH